MASITIGTSNDLQPGTNKVVEVGERTLALFNVDGTYYALDNTCPHASGPLGEGELDGPTVTCPWHGWEFNVTSGVSTIADEIAVKSYPVRVEGDQLIVDID